jgi:cytochrome c-type biogenesis protein CcmH/NrfG
VERVNKYLAIEPLDEEAWIELAEIYTEKGHYMKAAFCYEELLVLNPANDIYALKLSELYLSLGNKNTSDKAIKYLSYLITKRPDNLRALWVLYRALIGLEEHEQLRQVTVSLSRTVLKP